MKIAIVGAAGRMGKKLCELAQGMNLEVVSKVDIAEGYDRQWSSDTEGVIDF
jgi:dihydrodipicolinate reductase